MGSNLPVLDPAVHHRLMGLARGHDVIAAFGVTGFLPVFGEAKGDRIVTVAEYDDELLMSAAADGCDPVTALSAYEHAHHAIACGPATARALANRGVPASRLVPPGKLAFTIRSRLAALG